MTIIDTLLAERARAQRIVDACDTAIAAFQETAPSVEALPTKRTARHIGRQASTPSERGAAKHRDSEAVIIKVLKQHGDFMKIRELATACDLDPTACGAIVKEMIQQSQLVVKGHTNSRRVRLMTPSERRVAFQAPDT